MLLASPHWASGQAVASSAKAMASGGKEEGKGTSPPPLSASVKSVSLRFATVSPSKAINSKRGEQSRAASGGWQAWAKGHREETVRPQS